MRSLPRVVVKIASPSELFPNMHYFLNPPDGKWDWSGKILSCYPAMEKKLAGVSSNKEREIIERAFFSSILKTKSKQFLKKQKRFQKAWNKINHPVMRALEVVVECEWPATDKIFTAYMTPNPICPRWLKERKFHIYYRKKISNMKATVVHEIHHFIYFEKWKQLFPDWKWKEFETPHLVWKLSEMVPGIVLNGARIQKYVKWKHHAYKEFERISIHGKPLMSYLQKYYDERKDFEDFLKKSWKFVQKNEKIIKGV